MPTSTSCIRCPLLRVDPAQQQRLTAIRDSLTARIAEAEREGWTGETEGLKVSLAAASNKLAEMETRAARRREAINPGMPAFRDAAGSTITPSPLTSPKGPPMTMTALPAALRACASGIHVHKASAELLIGHSRWLERQDFTGPFIHASASQAMAAINWEAAITALNAGQLPCPASEQKILRLAASLAEDHPAGLGTSVTGLDDRNIQLLAKAILHASGQSHHHDQL